MSRGRAPTKNRTCCFAAYILGLLIIATNAHDNLPSAQCPDACTCTKEYADCSDGNYTSLPTKLPEYLTTLILSHNELTQLPSYELAQISLLQNLDLDGNKLEFFNSSDFGSVSHLRVLSAERNDISEVNISRPLPNATYFSFRGNRIRDVTGASTETLPALKQLDLGKNSLTSCHALMQLQSLETLYLDQNSLDTFESSCFRHIPQLRYLTVAHNSICRIDNTSQIYVQNLDMRGNLLTVFDAREFANMPRLSVLQMGKNLVDDNSLRLSEPGLLQSLKILNIDENKLQTFDSVNYKSLDSLAYLGLWRNNISEVRISTGPASLKVLSLAANQIKSFVVDTKASGCMSQLRLLHLQRNPLHCDCTLLNALNALGRTQVFGRCASPVSLKGVTLKHLHRHLTDCKGTKNESMLYCSPTQASSTADKRTSQASPRYTGQAVQLVLVVLSYVFYVAHEI